MADITGFSVSEFSSLGRICSPWWQLHEAALTRMENSTELVILFKGFCQIANVISMLGGSLVTTGWHVLRLRMEGTASRYGG
jgi:hypothetical protein